MVAEHAGQAAGGEGVDSEEVGELRIALFLVLGHEAVEADHLVGQVGDDARCSNGSVDGGLVRAGGIEAMLDRVGVSGGRISPSTALRAGGTLTSASGRALVRDVQGRVGPVRRRGAE